MPPISQRWRPPSFENFHKDLSNNGQQASRTLDDAMQKSFQNHYTLENLIASTQFGVITVKGTSLKVPTGLTTVKHVVASVDTGGTPNNFTLSATPSATPGCIDIRVFQPTSSSVTTPILATTAVLVRWSATGSA